MNKIFYVIIFLGMYSISLNAQWLIPKSVMGAGGTFAEDGNVRIHATVGQPIISIVKNSSQVNYQGFWYTFGFKDGIGGVKEEQTFGSTSSKIGFKNFPNPFNSQTTIEFNLNTNSYVNLKLFNSLGKEVLSLIDGYREAGTIKVQITSDELENGQYIALLNTSILQKDLM